MSLEHALMPNASPYWFDRHRLDRERLSVCDQTGRFHYLGTGSVELSPNWRKIDPRSHQLLVEAELEAARLTKLAADARDRVRKLATAAYKAASPATIEDVLSLPTPQTVVEQLAEEFEASKEYPFAI